MKNYAGTRDGNLYGFKKTSSSQSWQQETMGSLTGGLKVTGIDVGDGDNNSLYSVYTSNENGKLYQYTYSDPNWLIEEIATKTSAMVNLAVANLDGDNKNDLYAANVNGEVYRYQWAIATWQEERIAALSESITSMVVGDADTDGKEDMIIGCSSGSVYQIWYQHSGWQNKKIAYIQSAVSAITIGDGDHDHQHEIYLIDENNDVYELNVLSQVSPTPTPISTATPVITPEGFDGKIISKKTSYAFPNPTQGGRVKFNIYTAEPAKVKLKIFTTSNRLVHAMEMASTQIGHNQLEWNYSNIANGPYIYLIEAKGLNSGVTERVIKKVAIIK